jgi:hypothetical protein
MVVRAWSNTDVNVSFLAVLFTFRMKLGERFKMEATFLRLLGAEAWGSLWCLAAVWYIYIGNWRQNLHHVAIFQSEPQHSTYGRNPKPAEIARDSHSRKLQKYFALPETAAWNCGRDTGSSTSLAGLASFSALFQPFTASQTPMHLKGNFSQFSAVRPTRYEASGNG